MKKISELNIREPEYKYYQALALQKRGDSSKAKILAKEIEIAGNEFLSMDRDVDFFSKFGEDQSQRDRQSKGNYLLALADIINGNQTDARIYFEKAIELNPSMLWVKIHLKSL